MVKYSVDGGLLINKHIGKIRIPRDCDSYPVSLLVGADASGNFRVVRTDEFGFILTRTASGTGDL